MRVLVTGGGGFVGGFLLKDLVGSGHEVIAASHRPFEPKVPAAMEVFDLREIDALKAVLQRHSPEGVIHLAAQPSVPDSWSNPNYTFEVNVIGAVNLIRSVSDLGDVRMLLIGSAQQYGHISLDRPIGESDAMEPSSPYAITKAAQEMLGLLWFREFGRPILMTRSFNHTGPGQSSAYVVGSFCSMIADIEAGKGEPVINVGWLEAVRDFLDVRDVVRAYRLLLERGEPGEIYNVSSGQGVRIADMLKLLLDMSPMGSKIRIVEETEPRAGDVPVLVGDNSKIRSAVGWEPDIPLERSLADTLAWFRDHTN